MRKKRKISHRYSIFPIISIDPIDNTFLAHFSKPWNSLESWKMFIHVNYTSFYIILLPMIFPSIEFKLLRSHRNSNLHRSLHVVHSLSREVLKLWRDAFCCANGTQNQINMPDALMYAYSHWQFFLSMFCLLVVIFIYGFTVMWAAFSLEWWQIELHLFISPQKMQSKPRQPRKTEERKHRKRRSLWSSKQIYSRYFSMPRESSPQYRREGNLENQSIDVKCSEYMQTRQHIIRLQWQATTDNAMFI